MFVFLAFAGTATYGGTELTNQFPSNESEFNNTNPTIIWGGTTNFLRGSHFGGKPLSTSLRSVINASNGVIILSGRPLRVVQPACLYVENIRGQLCYTSTTNLYMPMTNVVFAYMPPINERLVLSMTDTNGAPVPKTPEGLLLGQPLSLKPKTRWDDLPRVGTGQIGAFSIFPKQLFQVPFSDKNRTGVSLTDQEVKRDFELDPTRYFIVVKSGLYKLAVVQCFYVEDTNAYLSPITLPALNVNVRIDN